MLVQLTAPSFACKLHRQDIMLLVVKLGVYIYANVADETWWEQLIETL